MAQRMQACTICHGPEGRATNQGYFPRIAGKPPGYLYQQLLNFREGRRNNAAMMYLVDHMSDDYLREIGQYFGSLDLPYPPPQPAAAAKDVLGHGEALVKHGDPARRIPSCVQCHGDKMTGVQPAFPGLLGLPRAYLIAQFGAWRSGQRKAVQPDCMHEIAMRLTPQDIGAVASWLAAQPLPPDPKPAATLPAPLPMACGSGPR
jgi:cytochrome c553